VLEQQRIIIKSVFFKVNNKDNVVNNFQVKSYIFYNITRLWKLKTSTVINMNLNQQRKFKDKQMQSSHILLPFKKECYIVLNKITKSAKIQSAFTLCSNSIIHSYSSLTVAHSVQLFIFL
jgi:hypothetical protein